MFKWFVEMVAERVVALMEYNIYKEVAELTALVINKTFNKDLSTPTALQDNEYWKYLCNDNGLYNLKSAITNACNTNLNKQIPAIVESNIEEFENYVRSEEFIDKIISRIMSKQLTPGGISYEGQPKSKKRKRTWTQRRRT